jgi:hypothetical protein
VQVGPVRHQVRRAELGRVRPLHRLAKTQARIIEGKRREAYRLATHCPQRVFEAERAQHLHGIRRELDAGAHLAELRRAFEDRYVDAVLPQCTGRGQPAQPRSDHNDTDFARHRLSSQSNFFMRADAV